MKDFRELLVWKNGVEIADRVYYHVEQFNKHYMMTTGNHMQKTAL